MRSKYEGQREYDRQHGHGGPNSGSFGSFVWQCPELFLLQGVEHWVDGARYEGKCPPSWSLWSLGLFEVKL